MGTKGAANLSVENQLGFHDEEQSSPTNRMTLSMVRDPGRRRQKYKVTQQLDILENLADRDLLFALLSHCLPWTQAATAASALVDRYGSFADVITAPNEELRRLDSMGGTAPSLLKSVHTAALRLAKVPLLKAPILATWDALIVYLQSSMARSRIETVRCLFMNTKNRLVADELLAYGDPKGVSITPRQILRRAIELDVSAIILVHNHPSGDPSPSPDDIELTEEINKISASLGIALHDHIIIGRGCEISLRRLGFIR